MQTAIPPADQVLLQRLQSEMEPDLAMFAAELGWTLSQLQQRIRHYEEQGWLRGFFGHLVGRSLGLDVTAFVLLSCQRAAQCDEISALTLTEEEVQECHTLGGEWTHLLKICTASTASLDLLVRRLQEWPSIVRTQSFVVMTTPKETPVLPLAMLPAFSQPAKAAATSAPTSKAVPSTAAQTRSLASQTQLPASQAQASQTRLAAAPAAKPSAAPSSAKATSFYPATSASRVAVQEPKAAPATSPQAASSTSMAAIPALPPLSASSAGLPAMLAFPPLSSPTAGIPPVGTEISASTSPNTAPSVAPVENNVVASSEEPKASTPSQKQAAPEKPSQPDAEASSTPAPTKLSVEKAKEEVVAPAKTPVRDPLASVSAAVDVLLPSIEIDVIGELDIATRAASNPQNITLSPSSTAHVIASPSSDALPSKAAQTEEESAPASEKAVDVSPDVATSASEGEADASSPESSANGEATSSEKSTAKSLGERLAFLKNKRQSAQQGDASDASLSQTPASSASKTVEPAKTSEAAPPVESSNPSNTADAPLVSSEDVVYTSMSSASMEIALVDQTLASGGTDGADVGGVYLSEEAQAGGALDEQLASLPSAFPAENNEPEPATLVTSAPKLASHAPETRQDLASVDSTNPGTALASLEQGVWLSQSIHDITQGVDEDPTFEVMIETLEVDEMRMVEVLSAVKRMFWSKLRDLSRKCSNENVIAFLHSIDVSPIRMAIRETSQEVVEAIADVYAQRLDEVADARQLDVSVRVQYILDQERRERILGDIRTPFREFVERLERLDQARDSMLLLLNDQISAQLSKQKPLLSSSLLKQLEAFEEPRGIETAWNLWLEALKRAMALYQEEAPEESAQLVLAMEQFISQFEPTYSAILNRILEIWTDKLLPPLETLMDA